MVMLPPHHRPVLLLQVLVLVFITLPWLFAALHARLPTGKAAAPLQVTPQPVETRTPLPTLADTGGGTVKPGSIVYMGLAMVCGMVFLLAAGVGAAILMVRLRNRIGR